ncbi:MAG: DinB family protein [Actinobacteria bacterium]|nr:DinB family protein [Actinomycetota bacterium]
MTPTTPELTPRQVALYLESSRALVESELRALGEDSSWHQAPEEWCAKAVVGHLIESEKRGFAGRIRIILENDHPTLEAWDQDAVEKERNDCARPTADVRTEFRALREESLKLVRSLKPGDLDRSGDHPKAGELFVRGLLHEWIHHDRDHTKQLLSISQERVWPHLRNSQKFKGE